LPSNLDVIGNNSSFKKVQFHSNFPPDFYTGRMINFEDNNSNLIQQPKKVIFRNRDLFSDSSSEDDDSDEEEEDQEEVEEQVKEHTGK
jgi:hypothetical protein